jgi:serine/threonine-protein kinase
MLPTRLARSTCALVLATFVTSIAPPLFAQNDKAAAEVLLTQALDLEKQGKTADACAKLEASLKLYPSVNTEYHLADCYEKLGKTATAWIDFQEVADKAKAAGETAKATKAAERAAAIASKVSHITIVVTASVDGLEVKRDGVIVASAVLGTALPIDPGEYAIDATAPGKKPFHVKVKVQPDGGETRVEIPKLADAGGATPAIAPTTTTGTPTETTTGTPTPTETPSDTSSSGSSRKTIGLIVAGTGIAAMAVGGVLGLSAKSSFNSASCNGSACDDAGLQQRNDARSKGNIATIVFVVGAAALVGGGVLWLTAPSDSSSSSSTGSTPKISAGVGLGSVVVGGSF